MKILHRFGVACFWGGIVAAALCSLWLGLIISAPGRGWHEAALTAVAIGGFGCLAGCAIRYIFGWRIHDV